MNASIKAVTYKARKETKQDNAILKAVLRNDRRSYAGLSEQEP